MISCPLLSPYQGCRQVSRPAQASQGRFESTRMASGGRAFQDLKGPIVRWERFADLGSQAGGENVQEGECSGYRVAGSEAEQVLA